MKINVLGIITSYLRTIRGERWSILSVLDFVIIFGLPIAAAYFTHFFRRDLGADLFLSLFTLFGVFIAVFMAVQGVLIPLYHSERKKSDDEVVDEKFKRFDTYKKKLIREVSYSLSYLKLFCLFSMSILVIAISINSTLFLFQWISVALAAHLILNLLVILKRLHSLFSHEFS